MDGPLIRSVLLEGHLVRSLPTKQMTLADAQYASNHKQNRKELFLIRMNQVLP